MLIDKMGIWGMILRVFPSRTKATPDDEGVLVGHRPLFIPDGVEGVKISVVFSWQVEMAERMEREWRGVGKVEVGGPAMGTVGGEFEPGMFLKKGYVITSRGCPNRCWFCQVWRRDGGIRELRIRDGWNVLDDNLLACSEGHIRGVFEMLGRQGRAVKFSGGLEAARLKDWHIDLLTGIRVSGMMFAYDSPDDLEPLVETGKKLRGAGFNRNGMYCYVLIGYKADTMDKAEKRIREAWGAGFMPMAMLYRDEVNIPSKEWRKFQRLYMRPAITRAILIDSSGI